MPPVLRSTILSSISKLEPGVLGNRTPSTVQASPANYNKTLLSTKGTKFGLPKNSEPIKSRNANLLKA